MGTGAGRRWPAAVVVAVGGLVLGAGGFGLVRTARAEPVPAAPPVALTDVFATDEAKLRQWAAFRKRGGPEVGKVVGEFDGVVAEVRAFLAPVLAAAAGDAAFESRWEPGGPWESASGQPTDGR